MPKILDLCLVEANILNRLSIDNLAEQLTPLDHPNSGIVAMAEHGHRIHTDLTSIAALPTLWAKDREHSFTEHRLYDYSDNLSIRATLGTIASGDRSRIHTLSPQLQSLWAPSNDPLKVRMTYFRSFTLLAPDNLGHHMQAAPDDVRRAGGLAKLVVPPGLSMHQKLTLAGQAASLRFFINTAFGLELDDVCVRIA
jgi:hypothetical protein